MSTTKVHILQEIKRTAAKNGGTPLGAVRFEAETGIRNRDWFGVYWRQWGDALTEAGFERNQMQSAYDKEQLLRRFAELAVELGRIPVKADLLLKRRRDPGFPSAGPFTRIGAKSELLRQLGEFCRSTEGFDKVANWCEGQLQPTLSDAEETEQKPSNVGYVYLLKHGARREYKIGRTNNALRREGQISIELPEKVQPVHVITTDDAAGIEAYWHNRFASKRKNGEWFELGSADVAAFKRMRC